MTADIWEEAVRLLFVGMAFVGLVLVAYAIFASYKGEYKEFKEFADPLAMWLSLVGAIVVAISVLSDKKVDILTREFTAPLMIVACLAFAGFALYRLGRKKEISSHAANGFSLLALSASLLILFPHPHATDNKPDRVYFQMIPV